MDCNWLRWMQVQQGGVRETPPTQQNRNNISKFWLITKTAKISTQGREPVTPDLLVLGFNGAPERQVQLRWLLIQSSPHPPTKKKQKKHLQIINHDNNYKNIIEVTIHGLAYSHWSSIRNRQAHPPGTSTKKRNNGIWNRNSWFNRFVWKHTINNLHCSL